MRSAIDVSGVASFSPKRRSRCTHSIGVSSPRSATSTRAWCETGSYGIVVDLAAGDDRHPLVEQVDERADHAGLRLATLAEEDDVVRGEQRVLELRAGRCPRSRRRRRRPASPAAIARDRVLAHLLLDRAARPSRSLAAHRGCRDGSCASALLSAGRSACRRVTVLGPPAPRLRPAPRPGVVSCASGHGRPGYPARCLERHPARRSRATGGRNDDKGRRELSTATSARAPTPPSGSPATPARPFRSRPSRAVPDPVLPVGRRARSG